RSYNHTHYRGTVFLDLTKTAVDRLAYAQGHELAPHGGTAVSVTPGWLRSEMMRDAFGGTEEARREAADGTRARSDADPPTAVGTPEAPAMLARGITALAADPSRAVWNTRSLSSVELAEHYDLTDVDGSRPDSWSFVTAMETTAAEELD